MSIGDKSRWAALAFLALLLLSLFWPAPIVSVNRLWLHQELSIDELSFLGREQPSWDVVFWCLAGLLGIAVVQGAGELQLPGSLTFRRPCLPRAFFFLALAAVAVVAATWLSVDGWMVRAAERVQSDALDDWIRIGNRLGGGMNPPLIVLFFLLAGTAYRRRSWVNIGLAMTLAGLGAGLVVQIIKFIVGRTRPELWLGPFHALRGSGNSFPSGHTVAAFALGGVIWFASSRVSVRVTAMVLACAVGASRVLAFRHWPSDVLASALISMMAAWFAQASISAKFTETSREQPASSIVTP